MRVYILSTQDKIPFAEELLRNIRNTKIISKSFVDKEAIEICSDVKKKIVYADVMYTVNHQYCNY